MTRIHITGNAGSGKSTLAAHVGSVLDLPIYGLDEVVWLPGWKKSPPSRRDALEDALLSRPSWVIEGVSQKVLQSADVVILLDVGRPTAYYRCAKRNWRYLFRSRPGMPHDCPELLIIPYLVRMIWNFPVKVQPRLIQAAQSGNAKFFHVRNRSDIETALSELGAS